MNPEVFYRLTEAQQRLYQRQPDSFEGNSSKDKKQREAFHFPQHAPLRFWYNTQTAGYSLHCHSALELILPVKRDYSVTVEETAYRLQPGDIFLIPPGMLHACSEAPSGARFIFVFDTSVLNPLPSYAYLMSLLSHPILINCELQGEIYEELISNVMRMAACYWQQEPLWELELCAAMTSFFVCYGRFRMSQAKLSALPEEKKEITVHLNRVFDYVKEHFRENITLEQAADAAGYSKYYFARIFKAGTGQSFTEYLRGFRIAEAKRLLLDECFSVTDAAFQAGFNSLPSFHRTFLQTVGCSPSEYRSYASKF